MTKNKQELDYILKGIDKQGVETSQDVDTLHKKLLILPNHLQNQNNDQQY